MHFTYESLATMAKDELRQGDVLKRTAEIDKVLEEVHPYFCNPNYKFFIVLSQSCDLVRRGGVCKSRYISLAAVRPLEIVLQRELQSLRKEPELEGAARIADVSRRNSFITFVGHLLNNTEPRYFYLHEELSAGLSSFHCALLRVSIAVKAREHYDTALGAKVLQLRPEFQAKLGWLTGNLYSRVGTEDWETPADRQNEFKKLQDMFAEQQTIWLDRTHHRALVAALKKTAEPITPQLAEQTLKELDIRSKRQKILDRLGDIITGEVPNAALASRIVNLIRNDPTLKQHTA